MAAARVTGPTNVTPMAGNFEEEYTIAYAGTDVPNGIDFSKVTVLISPADSPVTIRSKITDAVVADALVFGYTVIKGNVTLPEFQKGI